MPLGVVIPAAGRGERLGGDRPKALVPLVAEPLLTHTCRALSALAAVRAWVVLAPPGATSEIEAAARRGLGHGATLIVRVGGAERADSVRIGLEALPAECDLVAVHDAARPCVSPAELVAVVAEAERTGAAILALPCPDTVKRSTDGHTIAETVDRTSLWLAQTPQVFARKLLHDALRATGHVTDEASAVERTGHPVSLVRGSALNRKLTTQADVMLLEALLRARGRPSCGSDTATTSTHSS